MKNKEKAKQFKRILRKKRVRAKISGTAIRPRFSIFRSLVSCHAQMIDDETGKTLVFVSGKELGLKGKNKTEVSFEVGKKMAEKAQAAGIKECVFDKNGFQYHGRVKAMADGAREGGLIF
jgi:large subunit ribosomal protein L18